MKPYPQRYVAETVLTTGTALAVRPIRPDDEAMMVRFHEGLSDQSVYQRYFHMMTLAHRTAHERLVRVCGVDYDRELALVREVLTGTIFPTMTKDTWAIFVGTPWVQNDALAYDCFTIRGVTPSNPAVLFGPNRRRRQDAAPLGSSEFL